MGPALPLGDSHAYFSVHDPTGRYFASFNVYACFVPEHLRRS